MMRLRGSVSIAIATLTLAGCGYTPEQRATSGAALGGAGGLVAGAALGRSPGAALAGGVLGAATGAVVGANTRPPPPRCAEWAYDEYGRPVCAGYEGY